MTQPVFKIELGARAQSSTRAILWICSDIEIGHGAEVVCTVRPREPFRPERLAVHASCAGAFDLIDLKVTLCSVFTGGGADVPAARYAAAYKLQPQPVTDAWMSGPHRAVVPDETRLGLPIVSRVCPVGHDIAITVRHRKDVLPAALEVILLGTVLSEADGYQTYLREQQALEQAWGSRSHL
jgi:hypothetical protein